MRTSLTPASSAEICRMQGWGPGTLIVGVAESRDDDGRYHQHRHTLVIRAVGRRAVLAELYAIDGVLVHGCDEAIWDLHGRDWQAVE